MVDCMALLRLFKTISLLAIFSAWLRPITAGAAMFYGLHFCQHLFPHLAPILQVPLLISIGAFIFTITLLTTWIIVKKPPGLESEVIYRLKKSN